MPGHNHGPSIKNPRVYEALLRKGMSKSKAAAISNSLIGRGKKGKRTMTMKREYRQVPAEYRMDKGKPGRIVADVLRYDVVDDYRTEFAHGVFTESMDRRMPRICWAHDWKDPLGAWHDREETRQKLRLVGDLDLDMIDGTQTPAVPSAHRAYAQLRSGTIDEFSVGFVRLQDERNSTRNSVRITKGILDETSPVLVGSVPGTKLISVRSRRDTREAPAGSSLWVPADAVQGILLQFETGTIDLAEALQEMKRAAVPYDDLPGGDEEDEPDPDPNDEETEEDEEDDTTSDDEEWSEEELDRQLAELGLELNTPG